MKQQQAMGYPVGEPNAPQYAHTHHSVAPNNGEFSTGLCDCFSDVPLCCLTYWCPCITFGRIAEIVDKGTTSCGLSGGVYGLILAFTGCQWIYSCTYRSKMKVQYGMPEDNCGDCCTHFWCESCALCQEYRELEHRGYDVALGWHGNMERQNQGMGVAPTMPGGMTR